MSILSRTSKAVLSKQAAPSTLAPSTLTLSHISSHSQVSNKIKLIRLHLRSPDFSHISLPHRHDTHHADTPNLQSPNLANQSPPSLTPDLESCHNSHQVVAQKVKEAEITHGQQDSLLLNSVESYI
ncbi:hypothetical protein POPTR_012G066225v4 [Populus trichocarpa]|uniref:Uncharacterized protein n=1 Tax=Populus trichocarpa TaxID=3694 RepID=A0ACC0S5J3_POPTR|nr:hypothetical protein POPTR_012G066225v4 [Populus trichocarpa]